MQMCSLLWNAAAMEMKKFLGISSGMGRKEEIREEALLNLLWAAGQKIELHESEFKIGITRLI